MNNKFILLISAIALTISYSFTAQAGDSIIDNQSNKVSYRLYTENFSPPTRKGETSNSGVWSYNGKNSGDPDRNNGFGEITQLEDGKYAFQIGQGNLTNWSTSHPSIGTHDQSSPFTGNYLKRNVVSLSIDTYVLNNLQFKGDRPISLLLRGADGLTLYKTMQYCEPKRKSADCRHVPELPKIWTRYTFIIPHTWHEAIKDGWGIYDLNEYTNTPVLRSEFKNIMSDVQKVDFMFGAPRVVYGIQYFVIQTTNLTITEPARAQIN